MSEIRVKDLTDPASLTGLANWYVEVDHVSLTKGRRLPISAIIAAAVAAGFTGYGADAASGLSIVAGVIYLAQATSTVPGSILLSGDASKTLLGDGTWAAVALESGSPTFADVTVGTVPLTDNAGTLEVGGYLGHGGTTPKYKLESVAAGALGGAAANKITFTIGTDTYEVEAYLVP